MSTRSANNDGHELIDGGAKPQWNLRLPCIFVGVVAVAAFAPSIGYDWVGWDDEAYVTTSPLMSAPDGLRLIWASTEAEQYYPLTFTFLRLQYQLLERDSTGYHATCVLLHALNAVLLLGMLRTLGLGRGVSIATTLLFAVHPMQAMSVAWVAQQKNLLSCLFVLVTIFCWTRFRTSDRERWYLLSLIAFAAALLSKSAILTLPFAIIALDKLILRHRAMSAIVRALPMFALAAVALGLTVFFEKPFVEEVSIPAFGERVLIAGAAVWFYVLKLFCPVGLLPIYPLWSVSLADWRWWLPLMLLLGAFVVLWRIRGKIDRHALYGLVHFLVFLVPVLGLVPFGNLGVTYVSDHYVYVACIGLFLAVAVVGRVFLETLRIHRSVQVFVPGIIVFVLLVLTFAYAPVFSNAETMWTRTLKDNPTCFTAHAGLGQFRANQKDWSGAVSSYKTALDLRPDHLGVRHALGRAQMRSGQLSEAEATLRAVIKTDDTLPGPTMDLAQIAEQTGRYEEAIGLYLRALELDPDQVGTRIRLGQLYLGLSRANEAEAQFDASIREAPQDPWGYLGLATCWRGGGRSSDAVSILERGLRSLPGNVALLNLLARILATDPDETVRDGVRAVQTAREAERLTEGKDCLVLDTLAAAIAETGDFPQAVATAERAAVQAAAQGYDGTAQQLRSAAEHFRGHGVVRETMTNLTLR